MKKAQKFKEFIEEEKKGNIISDKALEEFCIESTSITVPLETYKARVDSLRFQLVENWCLCKWCQMFKTDCKTFAHWIAELKICINDLKLLDIKNGVDKRKTLTRLLVIDYDYDKTNMIARIIRDKFDTEKISDKNQRARVAEEFADNIKGLIDAISIDTISTNTYIQNTFNV